MIKFEDLLVEDLELSGRTANVLKANGITNMRAYMSLHKSEVLSWPHAGARTWNDIRELQEHYRYLMKQQEGSYILDRQTQSMLTSLVTDLNMLLHDDPRLSAHVEKGVLEIRAKVA